jgi:hypothetical protein
MRCKRRAIMRKPSVGLAIFAMLAGCGSVASTQGSEGNARRTPAPVDASEDALTTSDARGPDATAPDAGTDAALARCGGSTYTNAPNGAACDPSRIQVGSPESASCYAPRPGQWCDVLRFTFTTGDPAKVPAEFSCSAPSGGTTLCESSSFAGGSHTLDDATLDDLCSITQGFSEAVITCGIL